MMGAENIANASGDSFAMLFGVTSPKMSTMIVMAMVETVGPLSPNALINKTVAREDALMLTMLFPTRTEEMSSS